MTNGGTASGESPTTASNESPDSDKLNNVSKKKSRKWRLPFVIVAPYIVGLLWHCCHPLVSVFTGHVDARKWYIDENSLDPAHFRMNPQYALLKEEESSKQISSSSSLCTALSLLSNNKKQNDRISCHRLDSTGSNSNSTVILEMARIVPKANALAPVSEGIVLIVPSTDNWYASQFHYSILQLLHRLSSPETTPWLAKTILLVTPTNDDVNLHETVDSFLQLYLGSTTTTAQEIAENTTTRRIIDPQTTGAMIRNLLVVDVIDSQESSSSSSTAAATELRILPQGRRGVLPNLDLVFLCTTVYARSNLMSMRQAAAVTVVHPYRQRLEAFWRQWVVPRIPKTYHSWLRQLLDLVSFEYTLLLGPTQPHAPALDRGIDALTIQAVLSSKQQQQQQKPQQQRTATAQFVATLEPILRALSNLHERLHHSTPLYLLVSPERFVKHEEYLVPNLLLLIPCVIRALTLILFELDFFDFELVQRGLFAMFFGTVYVSVALPIVEWAMIDETMWWRSVFAAPLAACHLVVATAYLPIIIVLRRYKSASSEARQSLQFVACLMAIYVHVPIAFGHVSLAFPSAMLWVPLIAFPSYRANRNGQIFWAAMRCAVFFASCPFVLLVPRIFPSYTPYVVYAYLPLHILMSVLWLS